MHLAIIPGHGTRGGRYDPGASYGGEVEAQIVRRQAARLRSLAPKSITVHDIAEDSRRGYRRRCTAAARAIATHGGSGAIVHLHGNAGGGDYSFCAHDPRSTLGKRYADAWQSAAEAPLQGLGVRRVRAEVGSRDRWPNVWAVLQRSYSETPAGVCAVLIECGFLDQPRHARLWTDQGIDAVAQSILNAWL